VAKKRFSNGSIIVTVLIKSLLLYKQLYNLQIKMGTTILENQTVNNSYLSL